MEDLIKKEKKIHLIKMILAYLNVMIMDDNLPFTIAVFHRKDHPDYDSLKTVMMNSSLPNYEDLLRKDFDKLE